MQARVELARPDARLSYLRSGAGPAVLFLQGVGCAAAVWQPQLESASRHHLAIAPDNRGVGRSSSAASRLSVEAMADDALAIMDAEKIERFHVVGHSLGGLIAQEVALRAPSRISSLALLCTFARGQQGARLTPSIILAGLRTRIGTRPMRRKAFLSMIVPPELLVSRGPLALAEQMSKVFERDLADQPPIVMKQVQAMARYDAKARLSALGGIPTLVASAALDGIALPTFGRELASSIPKARYVELAGASHAVPVLEPEVINELLTAHWAA